MLPGMAQYVPPPDAPAWHAHYSMLRSPRPKHLSSLRTKLNQRTVSAISDKSGNLRPAAQKFVDAVHEKASTRSSPCSEAGLRRIERISELFDNATKEHSRNYIDAGMWGIFARGAQRNYEGTKVRFIHEQLCARGTNEVALRKMKQPTICEVGFCAGLSAMLFMESLPRARYVGWDLGDISWTESNIELMRRAYGERFLDVALGRAASTVPLYQQAHPELKCDVFANRAVVYIDGAKGYNPHMLNLVDMRNMSTLGSTLLLFDEATSEACVNGTLQEGDPTCDGPVNTAGMGIQGSARAYNRASRAGLIRVKGCAKTPYQNESLGWLMDTLCVGEYAM